MIHNDSDSLSELDRALVECLRIFARRGRELREAAEKKAADQAHSQSENNPDQVTNTLSSKNVDIDGNFLEDAHLQGDQQLMAGNVPDWYDI